MKSEKLARAIGNIDENLIFHAIHDEANQKKRGWLKWSISAAACLCLLVAAALTLPSLSSKPEPRKDMGAMGGSEGVQPDGEPGGYTTESQVEMSEEGIQMAKQDGAAEPYETESFPESIAADPFENETVIDSYGSMAAAACYATPDTGKVAFSIPLTDAMEEYGDSVIYRVAVDIFSDNQMLEANSEAAKYEMERLIELGYTVDYETYNDGNVMHYLITLCATKEQLTDFALAEQYGYMFFLYQERAQ